MGGGEVGERGEGGEELPDARQLKHFPDASVPSPPNSKKQDVTLAVAIATRKTPVACDADVF